MTMVFVGGRRRRWEIMLMPGDDAATIVEPENVWPFLARCMTPEDAELERAAVYTFHSLIASGWRRGRLMLAGDACHQTPPFLGQGMCAGIWDGANLAWKLAAIVRGDAYLSLLDTYESERRPHVDAFIELAVELGATIQTTERGPRANEMPSWPRARPGCSIFLNRNSDQARGSMLRLLWAQSFLNRGSTTDRASTTSSPDASPCSRMKIFSAACRTTCARSWMMPA